MLLVYNGQFCLESDIQISRLAMTVLLSFLRNQLHFEMDMLEGGGLCFVIV